jgi:hypothetical protein
MINIVYDRSNHPLDTNFLQEELIMQSDVTTTEECLALAKAELNVARRILAQEISNYPTPIAVCDCQFNYLLGQRQKIASALAVLEADTSELIQKGH